MTLAERLRLRWRRFSPLEERLFAAVRGVLPAQAVSVFDAQVRAIAHVQRLPGWTEIDYYPRRRGPMEWDGVPTFARAAEFALARVRFTVAGRRYRAVLSCVAGHIFDFGITPGAQHVAFADWDTAAETALLCDPSTPDGGAPAPDVPAAWSDMVATVGWQAAATGWTLHDAATAHRVTLDEGEFVVLAERDGEEFVLHRVEPSSDALYRLVSHDSSPEPILGSLTEVLRAARPNG